MMIYLAALAAILVGIWLVIRFAGPLFSIPDYNAAAAKLDREGAHEMLDRHIARIAMAKVIPSHFDANDRDLAAAKAAMRRILELEGEERSTGEIEDFILQQAEARANDMLGGKEPINIGDIWPL